MAKTIELNEAAITRLTHLGLDQLLRQLEQAASVQSNLAIPALGAVWPGQGGYFAGIARDENGGSDYALIVSPSEGDFGSLNWTAALTEAAAFKFEGHSDYTAPTQRQIHLCYANVPELFQKEWYWSSTQCSVLSAWCQDFGYGIQSDLYEDNGYRVRAVRRASIINSIIQ